MKRRWMSIALVISMLVLLAGCSTNPENVEAPDNLSSESDQGSENKDGKIKVAYSTFGDANAWPIALNESLESECTKRGYEFVMADSGGDVSKQLSDVNDLLMLEPDVFVYSPIEYEACAPALKAAKDAGIPVFCAARECDGVPGEDYVTAIRCNYVDMGYMQGEILYRAFGDKECNIVELAGTPGATNTEGFAEGFRKSIAEHPNMKIIVTQVTNYNTSEALKAMENIIQANSGKFNAVFCHSDAEALGAIQALEAADLTPGCEVGKDIIISSNCGYEDAYVAIDEGKLYSTVLLEARIGDIVLETIDKYFEGEEIDTFIPVELAEITKDNIDEYLGNGF